MATPPTRQRPGGDLDGWWRVGLTVVLPLARGLFRLRVLHADRIPADGPALLASNHVSVLDGPALAVPPASVRRRPVRFLVASEMYDLPLVGAVLRAYRQIPIRRGRRDAHALDDAVEALAGGTLAGIFPEGRVNPRPETLERVRRGAARIALAAGAPIVPVGIWGTQARWPRGLPTLRPPLRPPLTIAFGVAIDPDAGPASPEHVDRLTERVHAGISRAVALARADAESRRP
jgi:1-acyl-sn-glycerol-3-phosphate acyltransferase